MLRYPTISQGDTDRYRRAARLRDVVLVSLTAPLWLPVIMVVALAIKLDDPAGPVFFRQQRSGLGGGRFGMLKFRTMVSNAEEMKQELMHLNELEWPDFKITDDPRVTRVGKVLRRTSLDEIPQLINVLIGDMSLVGPRPTSFAADTYDRWHTARLDTRPGITGLWQLAGRAETEMDDRVRLDISYLRRRCMLLDLEILARTVAAMASGEGR